MRESELIYGLPFYCRNEVINIDYRKKVECFIRAILYRESHIFIVCKDEME